MSLDDDIKNMDTSMFVRVACERAIDTLGYAVGRDAINVFITGRKEYRTAHISPDIMDKKANDAYQRELNTYAYKKTLRWIDEQEYQQRRTDIV